MSDNLKIWNAVKQPPTKALKTIHAGRLKGKSDINPQWRMLAMTELFGPAGEGWTYTIDKLWTEPGIDGQVFAFAQITLYVEEFIKTTPPYGIPGIGGSMLIEKQSSGMHHNDEAFKMATTDALSVAMKAIGVAADIYLGLWDGSKYQKADLSSGNFTDLANKNLKHKPIDGAGSELSDERVKALTDISTIIKDQFEVNDYENMFVTYSEINDKEERLYLWTLLSSQIRSKLTQMNNERKA